MEYQASTVPDEVSARISPKFGIFGDLICRYEAPCRAKRVIAEAQMLQRRC